MTTNPQTITVHACPPDGSGLMPCCGRTPFETPGDRMTANPDDVTCPAAVSSPLPDQTLRDPIAALADDLRYVLNYRGPGHDHERPGVWDTSGKPCGHCARLASAAEHLAAYDADPAAVLSPPVDRADAVRALHQPMQRGPFTICAHCSGWDGRRCLGVVTDSPCATLRALDGATGDELRRPAAACICGHTEQQHLEDACINEVTGCDCGDYLPPDAAREVIHRWRQAAIDARADRAAVLREAAERLVQVHDSLITEPETTGKYLEGMTRAATELRRLAAEAQQPDTETRPRRGDQFEAWLKRQRDSRPRSSHAWFMVDCVLDLYRLHADTGTPLGEHVCEARVVGDCDCLETPAVPGQPAATDTSEEPQP